MAQIRGHFGQAGDTAGWKPIKVIKDILGRFLLRVSSAGVAKHYNGTAIVAPATQALGATTRHVIIQNTHVTNTLQVSFDGGANFYSVSSGKSLDIEAEISSVDVKADAADTTYEILTLE